MELIILTLALLLVSCLFVLTIKYPKTAGRFSNYVLQQYSLTNTLAQVIKPTTNQKNSPVASKNIKRIPESTNNPKVDPMPAETKYKGTKNHR